MEERTTGSDQGIVDWKQWSTCELVVFNLELDADLGSLFLCRSMFVHEKKIKLLFAIPHRARLSSSTSTTTDTNCLESPVHS